jgi:ATP-dependent Lon protease
MEVIELSSYTDEEKLSIAKLHLLNKQRKKHGLATSSLRVSDAALRSVISDYTRESGVRELERSIAAVCRKAASEIASGDKKTVSVTAKNLDKYLGVPKYKDYNKNFSDEVGLVHGLAYTSVGGEVLDVEAAVMDGSGKLQITGNLGKVMEESVKAAVTCIRTRSAILKIDPDFHKNCDIHIHFPEGAVPKDGPSAGITICMALTSALTGSPANANIAMTGEISLRGRVMPIGGLKEKSMAAYRYGIRTILIPEGNVPNLEEIDNTVRENVRFIPIKTVDDAFPFVFGSFDKSNTKNETLSKAAAESDIRLRQ